MCVGGGLGTVGAEVTGHSDREVAVHLCSLELVPVPRGSVAETKGGKCSFHYAEGG